MTRQRIGRGWGHQLLMCLMALCVVAVGCDRPTDEEKAPPAEVAAPTPLTVPAAGQVYRYVDPSDGAVKTSTSVEAIPAAGRSSVLVFDANEPTPAGWEHVVDLTAATPIQSTPTRGFVLRPSIAVAAPAPSVKARRAGHEVVMFSTQGCGYCRKARAYFNKHDVAHSEYDVERDPKAAPKLQALAKRAGVPVAQLQGGVPLIFIDGSPHVGFDQRKISKLLGL